MGRKGSFITCWPLIRLAIKCILGSSKPKSVVDTTQMVGLSNAHTLRPSVLSSVLSLLGYFIHKCILSASSLLLWWSLLSPLIGDSPLCIVYDDLKSFYLPNLQWKSWKYYTHTHTPHTHHTLPASIATNTWHTMGESKGVKSFRLVVCAWGGRREGIFSFFLHCRPPKSPQKVALLTTIIILLKKQLPACCQISRYYCFC